MERANLSWPHVPSLEVIAERLPLIFPEGTENRNYVIREMAARTLYVMFYAGAVEGADRWIRPSQVTDIRPASDIVSAQNLAFVTAFQDRSAAPFKKAMSELAWGTYAWFCSEPDNLIELRDGSSIILSELL